MMINAKIGGVTIGLITTKRSRITPTLSMRKVTRSVRPTKTRLLLVEKQKKQNIKQN